MYRGNRFLTKTPSHVTHLPFMDVQRLPHYLKKTLVLSGNVHKTKKLLRMYKLNTVCESAHCPNMSECFAMNRATFLIMGNACTRTCGFCAVNKGITSLLDPEEPHKVASAVKEFALKHVVITSVTRDDLPDGGADHFYKVAKAVKYYNPDVTIELLVPDFKGNEKALLHLLEIDFNIFNHNVETVPSLYKRVRPDAIYNRSLDVLDFAKRHKDISVKSGLMVGLGETADEVKAVLVDLKDAGCDIVTIGQYLMPTLKNIPVYSYINEDIYKEYEMFGRKIGIPYIYAAPFVRSSYHALEIMDNVAKRSASELL